MTAEKKIYELHQENQEWLKKLSFYKDEIKVFQKRVDEIAKLNTSKEFQAMVDHYQNQFFIQLDRINSIKHEIKNNEKTIEDSVRSNSVAVDHRSMPDHEEQREKVQTFEEIFSSLKDEFNSFLSKFL
ncbi:MAG: hypothetical protein HUU47_04815 [Bacteroidetes bacterium]|nr:hypothetical protein [Bacteroidota bacterium]